MKLCHGGVAVRLLLIILLNFLVSGSVFAGTCTINGVYDVLYDTNLDGKLDPNPLSAQMKFNAQGGSFEGKYVKPYRDHIFQGKCYKLTKSVISMMYNDKGNGYYSTYTITETAKDKYKGAWTDVRGNVGDYVMTKSSSAVNSNPVANPAENVKKDKKTAAVKGGNYIRIDKSEYSVVKDGVVKVYFDLPGFIAQQVCVTHNNGKVIRCSMHETSRKKNGSVDFYIPQPAGEYKIVVFYYDDKITDQRERNRLLETPRQTLQFKALP